MALDVTAKRGRLQQSLRLVPGPLAEIFAANVQNAERAAGGLYRHEASAWSTDPGVQRKINNRLGWMSSPQLMVDSVPRLREFAAAVKRDGFTDAVLLGMGGSSLAPEVLRAVLGSAPGWLRLHVLDSTDPAAIRAVRTASERTLYIIASKSGTTIEPNSLAAHFRDHLARNGIARWQRQFVAITDEDTTLERLARSEQFRDVFVNPSDIGGRYSALSFFGLVPASLMGQDIETLAEWGVTMLAAAEPGFGDGSANPAVALGLAIGAAAHAGRDKMTLIVPPPLEPFGLWVEQLIAESTGKNGTGIVPICGEPLAKTSAYGTDRMFVRVRSHGASEPALPDLAPRVDLDLVEPEALGAEFVRWEIATAVAGALLRINPFDEPNVQQAKDATKALLDEYKKDGRLPFPPAALTLPGGATFAASDAARRYAAGGSADALLTTIRQGDYFALLAYLGPDEALARELRALRAAVRDRTKAATMFGYGPRYLHSTGQLHKGGPNTGVFLLITAAPVEDVPIPGETFSFATLEQAQAIGDFQSLDASGRRAVHVHLPRPDAALLKEISDRLLARV
jgi:glucose-6-phosphate isomerase